MVLYICLFQNNMFAFMPEDDFGIKLKASKKLKNRNVLLNTMSPLYYLSPLPNWKVHRRNYRIFVSLEFCFNTP